MTLSFSNLTLVLGYHIMHTITETNKVLIVIVTLMLSFVTAFSSSYTSADCVTRKLNDELSDGTIPGYYSSNLDMIHLFSEGADLLLNSTQIPAEIDNFYCFTLSGDADSLVNNAIVYFYGLNSLSRADE